MTRAPCIILTALASATSIGCLSLFVPLGDDLTNGAATSVEAGTSGDAANVASGDAGGGSTDAGSPDATDGDASPPTGCAAPTTNQVLCDEFSGREIAVEWIAGITARGHLTLVNEPSVSKPHALRSSVDGNTGGDDARLFQNFAGPFKHARLTFDLQIESNNGDVAALALGNCAFLIGMDGEGLIVRARNGATGDDKQQKFTAPSLVTPSVWRRVAIDGSDTNVDFAVDGETRISLGSLASCGSGPVAVTVGIYAQVDPAVVYIDNVSLDAD